MASQSDSADFTLRLPALVKLVLLALTLWPSVWMVVFFTASDSDMEQAWFLVGHLSVVALIPLTLLVYALHIVRNPDLGTERAVWIALVAFLGPVGSVTYWALYLWPSPGVGFARGSQARASG